MSLNPRIYTDGSCRGNPGPGGWAYLFVIKDQVIHQDSAQVPFTTNNQMELQGVIESLRYLLENPIGDLTLLSDSMYVIDTANKNLATWIKAGWKTSKGPVKNQEQWKQFLALSSAYPGNIKWEWVKGHSGDRFNSLCDKLAKGE